MFGDQLFVIISHVFSNGRQGIKLIEDGQIVCNGENDANSFAIGVDDLMLLHRQVCSIRHLLSWPDPRQAIPKRQPEAEG